MEADKRKREDDDCEEVTGKRGKDTNGVNDEPSSSAAQQVEPSDEEVEEFFAILKRIQVAVKYFKRRRDEQVINGRDLMACTSWDSYFEPTEDRNNGVRKVMTGEKYQEKEERAVSLDLNSDPVCDVSDSSV